MQGEKYITIISDRKRIILNLESILYVIMVGKSAEIHVTGGVVYRTRMTLGELETRLGKAFIKVHRGCIVSAMAIYDVTDRINLCNGESLEYAKRKKNVIIQQLDSNKRSLISSFSKDGIPVTPEEYRRHYSSFDSMPFAFADIEMVFDEKRHAVDWIFKYGNPALAKLEDVSIEKLVGSSFASLFENMDSKWLRLYERATLYGETLETIDYSPEIDKYLKVTCFPTFKGHCGCILFDIYEIELTGEKYIF